MWNHLYMMLAHLDFTLTLMLAAIWYQVCDWKQIGSEKEREMETCGQVQQVVWLACCIFGWVYRYVLFWLLSHQPHALWNIHLSTGNSNHVYTLSCVYLVYGVRCFCVVRFHTFQMPTPKTTTIRRWNQHVRDSLCRTWENIE